MKNHISRYRTTWILSLLALCLISCGPETSKHESYSFFVAGHAYGNPNSPQYGLYPELMKVKEEILAQDNMSMGFLTGDVVYKPTEAYWDSAMTDIEAFEMPVHIAAGNHDKGQAFIRRFKEYYYAFEQNDDLIIVLAPNKWNIEGDQMSFLSKALNQARPGIKNVFIFCHELIWWSPDNEYQDVEINWRPHYPGSTNFWTDVKPLLQSTNLPIYFFAGDLGATPRTSPFMYDRIENIHLIASGLGSGYKDNILIVNSSLDSKVSIEHYLIKGGSLQALEPVLDSN